MFVELCMSRVEQRRPHKSALLPLAHTRALSDGETSVSQSVSALVVCELALATGVLLDTCTSSVMSSFSNAAERSELSFAIRGLAGTAR